MQNLARVEWTSLDYEGWLNYFKDNDKKRLVLDKALLGSLSKAEKPLITSSLTAFHQGERSEGRHLKACAEAFARDYHEPYYPEVISYFIKEENFHSYYLAQFMKGEGILERKKNVLDKLFTKLRQYGKLKSEVITLMTAEIIALTYYDLLSQSTNSSVLKAICTQMLSDELAHIVFQSYTLSHFKGTLWRRLAQSVLMEATSLFVYLAFRPFFRASGATYAFFRRENFGYLKQSEKLIKEMRKRDKIIK